MEMILRLVCISLLIGGVSTQYGPCNTLKDCTIYPTLVCDSGECDVCSSSADCSAQHTVRVTCWFYENDQTCVQCMENSQCSAGKTCVTESWIYLCASTCTSPTSNCGADSQCIYVSAAAQFYCLACENNVDCKNWSGNSDNQCSHGVCSPAFLSCGQTSDCTNPNSAKCSSNVCSLCGSSSDCTHLSETPYCNSGTCVQCLNNSNCTSAAAAYCSGSNTCIACTASTQCAHLTSTPLCSTTGSCVTCLDDSNCPSASAAQCSSGGSCVGCTSNTSCTHITSKPVCMNPGTTGTCVQCLSDSDCTSATAAHCSGSNTCVACTASTQCAHLTLTPLCNNPGSSGACVQCLSDSNCSSASEAHCSASNTCVACTNSTQCAHLTLTPVCNNPGTAGTCVQCLSDSNCSSVSEAHCSGSNTCVACTASTQCAHLTLTPVCKNPGSSGVCVQCLSDLNCSSASEAHCSASNTCVACTNSTQCAHLTSTPMCNTATGSCVTCLADSDCYSASAAQCSSNTCVGCTTNDQCTHIGSHFLCNNPGAGGTCVQCISDSNCSSPTAAHCSGNNTCIPCTGSDQCAHLTATSLCNLTSAACVQCLADSDCSSEAPARQCSINNNTCIICYEYQNSCYVTCPNRTYANSTDYTCHQNMTCKSANDCTLDKAYPECNGTTCVACADDTSCQLWYNQSNMTCNVASGACAVVDSTTQSITTAFSNVASSAVVAIGGVAAISTFAGGGGGAASQGFSTLRITKIGILIRYININFPYQTEKIFEAFSSSQSFIKTLLVGVFGDQQYNQTTIDLPTRFIKFADSSLFLKNAGNTLLLCLLVVILIVIDRILLYWARKKRNRTWIKRLLSLQKILEWNYILGYIMGTYPDLIVGLGLQFYNLPFSNPTPLSISSFVICAIIAPFAIFFPLICNFLMGAENEDRRRSKYHNITRYESLTSDFKENNRDTRTYQMIGLLRMQAIIFPLIFWQSNPLAQILFMIVSSVVANIFQMGRVPFKSKFTSFVILTNELLLLISMIGVFLHIVLNSSGIETSNPKVTTVFGWIIAVVLLSLMGFNLLINVIGLLRLAWLGLKPIIFRSKVPNQQRSSSRLPNRRLRSVPPSSLGNTSLNLSRTNNALVDNNMNIRIRPRKIRPIQ